MKHKEYMQRIGKIHKMYNDIARGQHSGTMMLVITQERNDHLANLALHYHTQSKVQNAGPDQKHNTDSA